MSGRLSLLTVPALKKQTASLIFLHGSGDSGDGIKNWLDSFLNGNFEFPHIKVIFPSAPSRLYTPTKCEMPVWFDRIEINPFCSEDKRSVDQMCSKILDVINDEIASGIPPNRIIIGGFSMGGALSFHCAFRFCPNIAGTFALSSFLNENSAVYEAIAKAPPGTKFPPLFQAHGGNDELVLLDWAKATSNNLSKLGIVTSLQVYPNLYHQLSRKLVIDLIEWISKLMPE